MPLQNRVDPWGRVHAVVARGTLLGNRGILHDAHKRIVATHRLQGWVTCRLDFKGIRRDVMSAGTYTELFFLDEATAFSAGHRPCAYCRRERYSTFKDTWLRANAHRLAPGARRAGRQPVIAAIDRTVHAERIARGQKMTYLAPFQSLPSGTMVDIADQAYLVWQNRLYAWSFVGYEHASFALQPDAAVTVLTPRSYVTTFKTGFLPRVHPSLAPTA